MPKSKKNSSKLRRHKKQSFKNKFPIFLMIIGGFIVLVAAFFAFQKKPVPFSPQVVGQPGLRVDNQEIDLGDVKLGNTVQTSFEITNVGDQPLKFSSVPYVEVIEGC